MEDDTTEFASYADDTTPYTYGQISDEIMRNLELDMSKSCELFLLNGCKAFFY